MYVYLAANQNSYWLVILRTFSLNLEVICNTIQSTVEASLYVEVNSVGNPGEWSSLIKTPSKPEYNYSYLAISVYT